MARTVELRLIGPRTTSPGPAEFAVATLSPVEVRLPQSTARPAKTVLVPVSDGSASARLSLDEGDYLAQLRLPDGSFVTDTLNVLPGASTLQHTFASRETQTKSPVRAAVAPVSRGAPSELFVKALRPMFVRPSSMVDDDDDLSPENSTISLVESAVSPEGIRAALKADSADYAELVGACIGSPNFKEWTFSGPIEGGGLTATVPLLPTNQLPATPPKASALTRRYAFVCSRSGSAQMAKLLLCLPGEWRGIETGRMEQMQVDVTHDWEGDRNRLRANLTLTDPHMQSILGFMQTGDMAAAMQVMDASLEVLYYKNENPYAAAGAAYLLMTGKPRTNAPWEDWVSNLARRFGDLPDGNILHATLLLQRGKQLAERFGGSSHFPADEAARLALASDRIQGALTKGVPLYRLGIRHLLTNLRILRESKSTATPMSIDLAAAERLVGWLSMRVDRRQPFTVLDISDV